uniref:Uncharacterized protein n=1 Tax=Parascaris univalens TaxID=6257 RepID=A0A915AIP9_PARUN
EGDMRRGICTIGLRCILDYTDIRPPQFSTIRYCRPLMAAIRSFQSYGLPKDPATPKVKPKSPKRRWRNDPALEEKFASILRKALHESLSEAVADFDILRQSSGCTLPDWAAVKMSSVLAANGNWDDAKKILDRQYLMTGANDRFARNASVDDHQIASALQRILSGNNAYSYEIAKKFYIALIDMRFCALKDIALKVFIERLIERNMKRRFEQ